MKQNDNAEEVVFGIRPEDIRIDAVAPHALGEVLAVEPLGAETIVRIRLPDVALDVLVRGSRSVVAKVGDRLPVAFDVSAAHLFDPVTTQRIAHERPHP